MAMRTSKKVHIKWIGLWEANEGRWMSEVELKDRYSLTNKQASFLRVRIEGWSIDRTQKMPGNIPTSLKIFSQKNGEEMKEVPKMPGGGEIH